MDYLKLVNDLFEKTKKDRLIIAIDGPTGSGKSHIGRKFKRVLPYKITHISLDDFLVETDDGWPSAYVDVERFKREVLEHLNDEFITYNKYLWQTNTKEVVHEKLEKIIVIEGAFALKKEFRDYYDYKIFKTVDIGLQEMRIVNRNGIELFEHYRDNVYQVEYRYFYNEHVLLDADLIL